MVRLALILAVVLGVAIPGAMLWQHLRYLHARRDLAGDRQPLLHDPGALHVVLYLEARAGADLLADLRALRDALEADDAARVVYVGRVVLNALASSQLAEAFGEEVAWEAVVLAQLPSRAAWTRAAEREDTRQALARFQRTYAHGMERSPWVNLAIPQALLALRLHQIVTRAPSHFPFEAAEARDARTAEENLARLEAAREPGRRAVVVANLVRTGSEAQAAADRRYARRMLGLMAEGAHGPLHLGRGVSLDAEGPVFDRVALVYYPGVDYFAAMARSRFYQGIVGDKQLGDTQASVTVPLQGRL